jgi:3-methyladenine DNA glycosylase AlkD
MASRTPEGDMPAEEKEPPTRSARAGAAASFAEEVEAVLASLKRIATKRVRDGMARYGLPSDRAFGVPVGALQKLARRLGRNHGLAGALWETGWYEARMLAAFVDDPAYVTPAQMDRWCRDFDNWGICDTVCFQLFDRTPHAWSKVAQWAVRREEFVRRAAFALLWGLTVHDKQAADGAFSQALVLVERAAADDRHFVKKAVNMALRAIGKRNLALNAAALEVAERLSRSKEPACRQVGGGARRELSSPRVRRRLRR